MQNAANEFQSVGGPGFGGFGGFGGIAPVGLFGLFGGRGFGDHGHSHGHGNGCFDDCASKLVMQNTISGLKDSVSNAKDALSGQIQEGKDSLDGSIDRAKDALGIAIGRVGDEICDVKREVLENKFDLLSQLSAAKNDLANQATAYAIAADRKADAILKETENQGQLTRALITQTTIDNLRDQLAAERRRGDAREIEISINNNNAQAQAQFQAQNFDLHRKFDALFSQVAKAGQDIINVGGLMAGVAQTANPVNVKS